MTNDLISREALLHEIEHHHPDYNDGQDVANWQMTCIKAAPTIDAEPVRHGQWIDVGDFESCSLCRCTCLKEIKTYYGKATRLWVKTNYCPNCGAKMDSQWKVGT